MYCIDIATILDIQWGKFFDLKDTLAQSSFLNNSIRCTCTLDALWLLIIEYRFQFFFISMSSNVTSK